MHRLPLRIAGIIFLLVAVMYFIRVILRAEIVVAGYIISPWVSLPGFVVAGLLSVWMFRSAR